MVSACFSSALWSNFESIEHKHNLLFFSGLHKMLIFLSIIVHVFHNNNFFPAFVFPPFFDLTCFGLFYIGLLASYCVIRRVKIFLCVQVCALRFSG